jgi:hypothetical protein
LFVLPKAPEANVFVKDSGTLPAVRAGEVFFWVRLIELCWTVTICKPVDNTVTSYSVGQATGERNDLVHIAGALEVEKHQLCSTYQQVRGVLLSGRQ